MCCALEGGELGGASAQRGGEEVGPAASPGKCPQSSCQVSKGYQYCPGKTETDSQGQLPVQRHRSGRESWGVRKQLLIPQMVCR